MLAAVRKAGVRHMVNFNYRRCPAVVLAKNLIDAEALVHLVLEAIVRCVEATHVEKRRIGAVLLAPAAKVLRAVQQLIDRAIGERIVVHTRFPDDPCTTRDQNAHEPLQG